MLTAIKVRSLNTPGRYGDGNGLWLQVRDASRKSWLFRYKIKGQQRSMGLGPVSELSLAEAREKAAECRRLLRQGIDPLEHRRASRTRSVPTFREVAELYIAAHQQSWRNPKHRQQWTNTLSSYAFPVLGDVPVSDIDIGLVLRVIEPLWLTKTETASRVRGRIENILDYAAARGWRTGDNPARWRGHMQKLLPARSKTRRVKHHDALAWQELPAFMAELRQHNSVSALALELAILTAARTGEVIGMRWSEITDDVWTVPADRMKAGKPHRVPLSEQALDVLSRASPSQNLGPWIFPGTKKNTHISNMSLLMLLRRMQRHTITVHGFRSTFRQWVAEARRLQGKSPSLLLLTSIRIGWRQHISGGTYMPIAPA
jgi:integrase